MCLRHSREGVQRNLLAGWLTGPAAGEAGHVGSVPTAVWKMITDVAGRKRRRLGNHPAMNAILASKCQSGHAVQQDCG